MKNSKSQVRLFESIAVLIVFVFIISIGIKVYTNITMSSLKDAEKKFNELDSVKASIILSNLPEISCSFEGISEYSCLDFYKVQAWSSIIQDDKNIRFIDYYVPMLGYSDIYVERIYPKEAVNLWVIYNSSIDSSFDYMRVPVVIYDAITKKKSIRYFTC